MLQDAASHATVVTHVSGERFAIQIRSHQIMVDQTLAGGGSDSAPTPIELLGASLGSCVAYYVRHFCRRSRPRVGGTDCRGGTDSRNESEPHPGLCRDGESSIADTCEVRQAARSSHRKLPGPQHTEDRSGHQRQVRGTRPRARRGLSAARDFPSSCGSDKLLPHETHVRPDGCSPTRTSRFGKQI